MKIVVVGGTGIIGKKVVERLSAHHEVIAVGRTNGQHNVDVTDPASIRSMFAKIGHFDALISTVGDVHFAPLSEMGDAEFRVGLNNKLMGQVNLVLIGREYIRDNGSFTLTSGMVSGEEPIRGGASIAMVHAALEGFVKAAALELPRGVRMNIVAMTIVEETMSKALKEFPALADAFSGYEPVLTSRVALAFQKSVEGIQNGRVYRVWGSN
jgi:NAD(P)-dependent dehydrogenase (short-subunit alcohol dehydrogenase family)